MTTIYVGDPLIDSAFMKVRRIPSIERSVWSYWEIRSDKVGYNIHSLYWSAVNSIAITSQALYYFLNNFENEESAKEQKDVTSKYYFYLYGACNAAYVQQDGLKSLYNLSTDFKKAYEVTDNSAWAEIRDLRAAGFAHPTEYKTDGNRNFVTMMYFGGLVVSAKGNDNSKTEKIPVSQPKDFLQLFADFRQESVVCLEKCAVEMDKLKDVATRKVKQAWDEQYS